MKVLSEGMHGQQQFETVQADFAGVCRGNQIALAEVYQWSMLCLST